MLFVDHYCELVPMIEHLADELYYQFDKLPIVPGATYIVGREEMRKHSTKIRDIVTQCNIVYANPAEGSSSLLWDLKRFNIDDLILQGHIKLVGGGRMPPEYKFMLFEHFLTQPFRFEENRQASLRAKEIYAKRIKPYKFLCLNGRFRPHRAQVIHGLGERGLLNSALWTNLDSAQQPIKLLPPEYEVERYNTAVTGTGFVKQELFAGEWGDIYIRAEPYIDTYFSVVTETVWDMPYSFFTEKIAKPLAMGHPFIVAANSGFYRDLQNLGFRTFSGLIDESFDSITSDRDRLKRMLDAVDDLCQQDLELFITAAEPICKYNQQHLKQLAADSMATLPQQLLNFIHGTDPNN